jgi:hypothetical protein
MSIRPPGTGGRRQCLALEGFSRYAATHNTAELASNMQVASVGPAGWSQARPAALNMSLAFAHISYAKVRRPHRAAVFSKSQS